ncbi:Mu-like prophage major head subunit gpT [Thalassoglobus neptunius]|uniref:Mu-like prophage major head subunit gpT n=1 Tax=Thalassoglobus neptunius TaxID=1938619 RepID=A0A5C5X3U4_9PLAN|nr:Mu-like prophage major head subunit gpT family protein [Thalassoglobus neptunius]TWT57249.1 Mu-like prophage major head subunit gpT [Thalassoglobus neptunius]
MALNLAAATAIVNNLTATFDASARAANPFYPEISFTRPSTRNEEKYGWVGDFPGMREWLGERKFNELRAATYTLENKHWESSMSIKKTDMEDDNMGLYPGIMQNLGAEATHHPDELFVTALENGETDLGFDGQAFFDTDHSWGSSGTQSNDLTYNASDPDAVTDTEFLAAYHQARTALLGFKGDNGKTFVRPVVRGLGNLMILVPLELEVVAHKAIQSALRGGGDTNIVLDQPQIVAIPGLTSGRKFYLSHNDSGIMRPFVFQPRQPLSRQVKGLDDIEFKEAKFMTEARYNIGYLFWFKMTLTTFT